MTDVVTVKTDTALLRKYTDRTTFSKRILGWKKVYVRRVTRCVAICVVSRTNNFIIDCYLRSGDLNDLKVKIYVDNVRMYDTTDYTIFRQNGYAYIKSQH